MKIILLLAFLLPGLAALAQTNTTTGNCRAQFKYEVNTQTMNPLPTFNFYDKSDGNVIYWFWDFGDGTGSEEKNPVHAFSPVSISGPTGLTLWPYRVVSLTILTSDSCKSYYSDTIQVSADTVVVPVQCHAEFNYYQSDYDSINGTATFRMTNLSQGDSLIYSWNFDNQSVSSGKDPSVTFDFSRPERKVCLTVTGPDGCTDTFCNSIILKKPEDPVSPKDSCFAYIGFTINYTIQTFAPALVLDFYSKSVPDAVEWNWDFGDGTTNSEAQPTHIYNLPLSTDSISIDQNRFRKVVLTTKSAAGCVATATKTIDIYMSTEPTPEPGEQCHAWFKYYRPSDVVTIPEVVPYRFSDASEGKVISRLWEFEDGSTSSDAELQVNFDFLKPTQKVCLTITTADSCTSTWCDIIYVTPPKPDTSTVWSPSGDYIMRFTSSFPPQLSSCAGYAKAQVYKGDSAVNAIGYAWSTGESGQEITGLCPTQVYTVKATTPDGTIVSGTFVFNSDGTVSVVPVNWWISGTIADPYVNCEPVSRGYTVEWRRCDGSIATGDSIALNEINCADGQSNLLVKDTAGNIVYSENISLKALATAIRQLPAAAQVKIYPNPVDDVLNIEYSGNSLALMQVELFDGSGKHILSQQLRHVESGQSISLNIKALRSGIYLCKLTADRKVIATQKIRK